MHMRFSYTCKILLVLAHDVVDCTRISAYPSLDVVYGNLSEHNALNTGRVLELLLCDM